LITYKEERAELLNKKWLVNEPLRRTMSIENKLDAMAIMNARKSRDEESRVEELTNEDVLRSKNALSNIKWLRSMKKHEAEEQGFVTNLPTPSVDTKLQRAVDWLEIQKSSTSITNSRVNLLG
jgi:MinD-like ATPase involved in chromosome partitioning or flagellar assembly